ncbi:MAG: cellulase family glycosylhydrolase [Myxococcota bacterium]
MKQRALPSLVACLAAVVFCSTPAIAADVMIEDFETDTALSRWVFSNGGEFPGAKGTLTRGGGHAGSGAHIAYDLMAGGRYVSASLTFDKPLNAKSIAFWVKEPPRSQAKVRLYDSSGQTLEYAVPRPLEAFDASSWFRVVLDVYQPTGYYGGANDGVPHAPLTGISILAIPEFEIVGSPTGAIDIDELAVVDTFRSPMSPTGLRLIPAPAGSADLSKNFAVNIHQTNDDRALDSARDAGFSAVRMDVGWSDIETTRGVYDFSRFDALLSSLTARGMRMHLIVDYLNPLYPLFDGPDFMGVTVPAFSAMARALAAHFAGSGVTYEIWNEPNGDTFWKRSAADFAALCASATAAIHAADPAAKVCSGGVSGFDYRFVDAFLAAGGGAGLDAIGVHPYRKRGGETVAHDLLLMRAIIGDRLTPVPPIWDTEWGYSSTWYGDGHSYDARLRQAQMVARELLSAGSMGFPFIVYYDLRDGGTDAQNQEHNFGLLTNDHAEKPALVAVRTLTRNVKDHRFVGFLETGLSSLHALRLDGARDHLLAVWWDNPREDVVLELPPHTRGMDMLGRDLSLDSASPSELTWRESWGPVYLSFAISSSTTAPSGTGGASSQGGAAATSTGGFAASGSASLGAGGAATASGGASNVDPVAGADNGESGGTTAAGSGGVTTAGRASANLITGGYMPTPNAGSGSALNAGAANQADPEASAVGAGCGCSVVGAPHGTSSWASLVLGAGLLTWMRRRRAVA